MAGNRNSARMPRLAIPKGPSLGMPSIVAIRRAVLLALVVALALVALFFFWFRHSSFVAIDQVQVHGAEDEPSIVIALDQAAQGMSALDLDVEELRAAVSSNPLVRDLSAEPALFHAVRIDVDLRRPAGVIGDEGGSVVADDGVILPGFEAKGLPVIEAEATGDVVDGEALELATALGPVPEALRESVSAARFEKEHGIVIELEAGIELRFGDSTRAADKWTAATAVLADAKLKAATYIDLMVPQRPVSGV